MKRNDGLTDEYFLYCGASLISSTQILTAAHCVSELKTYSNGSYLAFSIKSKKESLRSFYFNSNRILGPDRFIVLLGMHFINDSLNDAKVTKRVRVVTVHEEFDSITHVSTKTK